MEKYLKNHEIGVCKCLFHVINLNYKLKVKHTKPQIIRHQCLGLIQRVILRFEYITVYLSIVFPISDISHKCILKSHSRKRKNL